MLNKGKDVNIRALVVDDNEVNTLILANMLELFGIQVDQVLSGELAVKMFKKYSYRLVFIDHIMPDMDGIKTTEILRSLSKDKTAIFVLTSHISDSVKYIYREKGANDVFAKPLGLTEVITILKEWVPQLPVGEESTGVLSSAKRDDREAFLKSLLSELPEINYEAGLKYAIGNPVHFIHILKISVKDIRSCINNIIQGCKQDNVSDVIVGIHNLKRLFSNIGATGLYEYTNNIYDLLVCGEYDRLKSEMPSYIIKTDSFNFRLENVMNQMEDIEQSGKNNLNNSQCIMSEQEYEQCLSDAIYYIMSFEYDSIVEKLQQLINTGRPENKMEFVKALEEINDFDYDNALARLKKIKEKDR